MGNRRQEVAHYRQALHLMQQNQSDRAIAKRGLMGHEKAAKLRALPGTEGWLKPVASLSDDTALAARFDTLRQQTAGPVSSPAAHQTSIEQWVDHNINGRVILRVLRESNGDTGSYSSVHCMMYRGGQTTGGDNGHGLRARSYRTDFGKGPEIVDQHTGEVCKTWFFVRVVAWSRHLYAELVTDQSIETWLGCHRRAFEHFGVIDGMSLYRDLKVLNREGINLSYSTLCCYPVQLYERLECLREMFYADMAHAKRWHPDATTLQVLQAPDRVAKTQSYLWCSRTISDRGSELVLFHYNTRRNYEARQAFWLNLPTAWSPGAT